VRFSQQRKVLFLCVPACVPQVRVLVDTRLDTGQQLDLKTSFSLATILAAKCLMGTTRSAVNHMVVGDEGTVRDTKATAYAVGLGRCRGQAAGGNLVATGASETSTEPMLDYSAFLGFQLRAEA
jgi:hypothetical protein